MTDPFEKFKDYEREFVQYLDDESPSIIRLDGRAFHSFCKGLQKPFDHKFAELMIITATYLAKITNARIAYTQSDEISLCLLKETPRSQIYFDGKTFKINSVLAAEASVFFNKLLPKHLPEKAKKLPVFDCRSFNIPMDYLIGYFVWRTIDASRNSVSGLAQSHFSPKQLHGKKSFEMKEMLREKYIEWDELDPHFKYGTYIQRHVVPIDVAVENLESLPPKHHARTNPQLLTNRTIYRRLYTNLELLINPFEVILKGRDPIENQTT